MLRDTCFPINQLERLSCAGSATGQKNYALAWKRAQQLQFDSQIRKGMSGIVTIPSDVLSTDKGLRQKRISYQRKI
jgi:hypothetical protein